MAPTSTKFSTTQGGPDFFLENLHGECLNRVQPIDGDKVDPLDVDYVVLLHDCINADSLTALGSSRAGERVARFRVVDFLTLRFEQIATMANAGI